MLDVCDPGRVALVASGITAWVLVLACLIAWILGRRS